MDEEQNINLRGSWFWKFVDSIVPPPVVKGVRGHMGQRPERLY